MYLKHVRAQLKKSQDTKTKANILNRKLHPTRYMYIRASGRMIAIDTDTFAIADTDTDTIARLHIVRQVINKQQHQQQLLYMIEPAYCLTCFDFLLITI